MLKSPLFWLTVILVIGVDRLAKLWVIGNMAIGSSIPVWRGVFHLTHIRNTGVAFGTLVGFGWLLNVVGIIALICILKFLPPKMPHGNRWARALSAISLGMIVGGALGNIWDRVLFGGVVDFLDFQIWPYIFNPADSAIVVGFILLWLLLFTSKGVNLIDKGEK
jgi:signal peptidase II